MSLNKVTTLDNDNSEFRPNHSKANLTAGAGEKKTKTKKKQNEQNEYDRFGLSRGWP